MLMLRDFRCEGTQEIFERMVDSKADHVRCNCGSNARRIISPIRCQLEGASGDFPGAHMKWIREHEGRGGRS
jgi:hypothetical protein